MHHPACFKKCRKFEIRTWCDQIQIHGQLCTSQQTISTCSTLHNTDMETETQRIQIKSISGVCKTAGEAISPGF